MTCIRLVGDRQHVLSRKENDKMALKKIILELCLEPALGFRSEVCQILSLEVCESWV